MLQKWAFNSNAKELIIKYNHGMGKQIDIL